MGLSCLQSILAFIEEWHSRIFFLNFYLHVLEISHIKHFLIFFIKKIRMGKLLLDCQYRLRSRIKTWLRFNVWLRKLFP